MTDFLQDHPDGQVIALDEMSLYFQATTTRVWSPVGQTPVVRVSPYLNPQVSLPPHHVLSTVRLSV